jgi:hypothetical protein
MFFLSLRLWGAYTEKVFLDVLGTKILRLFLHPIHVTSTSGFYSPLWFLGLEISTATAESEWGLGFV